MFDLQLNKMDHRRKSYSSIVIFLIGLLVVSIPVIRFAIFALSAYQPGSPNSVIMPVQKGQSPNEIAKSLVTQSIVSDGRAFIWVGRLFRQWKNVKAGEYRFSPAMSPLEVFSVLTSGVSVALPITVREGENFYEVADDLASKGLASKAEFLKLCRDRDFIHSLGFFKDHIPQTLEGYLFPDTYFFNHSVSSNEMIKQMVRHFFDSWGSAEEERAKALGFNREKIVILASMIEKETGAPEERPLISSVFHNRLHKHMRLQSDPTTIYGMWERFKGKIHKRDLSEKNDYNTYTVNSLPIGPISNPGRESIHAALYPAQTNYLYFVSHNDGTQQFSATMEEHNRAVAKFQLDPKARQGKSWRDRLKKPASISSSSDGTAATTHPNMKR